MTDIFQEEFMDAFKRLIEETTTDALLVHDTKLEDRIDDLESQGSDHEDRIDVLDGLTQELQEHVDCTLALETRLSQLDDISNIIDRKIQQLLTTGRIKLYLAAEPPTQ
jgi:uncharacterized coiled-coil protein SlyX